MASSPRALESLSALARRFRTFSASVVALFTAEIVLEPILHGGEAQGLSPAAYPGGLEAAIGVLLAGLSVVVAALSVVVAGVD